MKHTETLEVWTCPHCAQIRLESENEELKAKIESLQSDYQQMYERCLQQHNDIDFWKRENSQSRAQYNGLVQEVQDLRAETEQLQNLWNAAYDLGVRVEIDSVTGEISRRWMESAKRK